MQCPVCDERLREVQKYGVMVDICPACKGVWLDRGELEKVAGMESRGEYGREHNERDEHRDEDRRGDHGDRGAQTYHGKPKKRSFLSDLMEGLGD